jgi:hypothetical protein
MFARSRATRQVDASASFNITDNISFSVDAFSARATRGAGGNGLWAVDQLWVSKNFVASRTLASGPIRALRADL